MGCCQSLFDYFFNRDGNSQNSEANERTHLLVDPVAHSSNIQINNCEDFLTNESGSSPKKTDEQSALNRILQDTAQNVIDVAALDSHNLQQHEYYERVKIYNSKLAHANDSQNQSSSKASTLILQDVPSAEKYLASDPMNKYDYTFITTVVDRAHSAIKDIKVEHKEDLVVPFHIP